MRSPLCHIFFFFVVVAVALSFLSSSSSLNCSKYFFDFIRFLFFLLYTHSQKNIFKKKV